ncbi:MAG: TonB family protein [Byssovorax sp.]
MSYRSIALASCVFLVACGGAPPPAADAPRSSGNAASEPREAKEEKPDVGAAASATIDAAPPPPHGSTQGQGEGHAGEGTLRAAVVDSTEPLGGKLTQADIGRILEKNGDVFGDCYTLGAGGKMKDFKGVVTVKATIGPSGTVNQVDVTKSTANNAKVDSCVREAFKKIKFPKPRDGATSVITFPISFNGVEQIQ